MPLDPQAAQLLEAIAALTEGQPATHELTPTEARAQYAALAGQRTSDDPLASIDDHVVVTPDGDIPVRLYRPDGDGALPVTLFFHGGGWVLGDIASHDALCRSLASRSGVVVASVDYRLAPEARYPAALDDCLAAIQWVAANGSELGVDPEHLAVAGDSAGGNLAAAACLSLRDRASGPPIALQLLVYPVLELSYVTPSATANAEGYFLTLDAMRWFTEHYVPDPARRTEPYASPLLATDLTGLPPAHVITAEYDLLRDEGEAYARALEAAGVPATLSRYEGMIHGFVSMASLLDAGARGLRECATVLRQALHAIPAPGPAG